MTAAARRAGGRPRKPKAPAGPRLPMEARIGGAAVHHANGSWGLRVGGGPKRADKPGIVEKMF